MKTTAENITDAQIERLLDAAGEAGDLECVDACERALEGDLDAKALCAEIISDGEAMEDEEGV